MPEGYLLDTDENREACRSLSSLEHALLQGTTLEGTVTKCDTDKNLTVRLGSFTGIIPRNEAVLTADDEEVRDIAVITRVGKAVCVKITDIIKNEDGRYGVASELLSELPRKICQINHKIDNISLQNPEELRIFEASTPF